MKRTTLAYYAISIGTILFILSLYKQPSVYSANQLHAISSIDCSFATAYLPYITRNDMAYFEGPWESEPNDDRYHANGPLRSGRIYYGYPDNKNDFFSIYLSSGSSIFA